MSSLDNKKKIPSSLSTMESLNGRKYWRSLDQVADTPEFQEFVEREFPQGATELKDPITRRNFLTVMGASLALAGLASCRRPAQKIVPYVIKPEDLTPGIPQFYATNMPFGMNSYGLIVESHEGRPTKIEGNPRHPSSLGATTAQMQAETLTMYDPDRDTRITDKGTEKSWSEFVSSWRTALGEFSANNGAGLAVISGAHNSPTMARLKREFSNKLSRATWATYEPVSDENAFAGVAIAAGKSLAPVYDYSKATVIAALDSDFLAGENESISAARGFADGRRVIEQNDSMNRLYAVESYFSLTGGMADHRLRVKSSEIGDFAVALAKALGSHGVRVRACEGLSVTGSFDSKWINALAKDLASAGAKAVVTVGRKQPAAVHALVTAINDALGAVGTTVSYYEQKDALTPNRAALANLVEQMNAGSVKTLVILGGNPVYDAPADLNFASALKKVSTTIHLSMFADETSAVCQWHIPETHFLESWGDTRALNGVAGVTQPLIAPLYGGHSAIEVANLLATGQDTGGYELVRETWRGLINGLNFEKNWEIALHDGVLEGSERSASGISIKSGDIAAELGKLKSASGLEVVFTAGAIHDGRYANNGWMQELPDPVTKLTWDNAAVMSPNTAKTLGVENHSMISLSAGGASVDAPVWILPGHVDNSITIALGYGRTSAGRIGDGVGFNAYALRKNTGSDFITGASALRISGLYKLASSQDHGSMEGRPIIREGNLDDYKEDKSFVAAMNVETPPLNSLWTEHTYTEGYQWGMTIDLNSCTGCNACTIACQSENNIPVVSKEQVDNGREMHWLRMDRYFEGDVDDPQMVQQPMACQHCEMAPCEQVCPVAATVHDEEGLNVMVYNRCVGTRYCSNNCPYKVRRFNFFNYTNEKPESEKLAMNPDVTVRSRGVMEKCTYCVQRISRAKLTAKSEGREVGDGEIVTACQQSCPANAIVFGNVNDPESDVSKLKARNLNYQVLPEINTRPRTSYLAKLRNPNPELS